MIKYLFVSLCLAIAVVGCNKVSESPDSLGLTDVTSYCPIKVGNVFVYRMDSTSVTLGSLSTSHYLAKDSVSNTFLDKQGRTCYMILRFLTDTLASQPYQYNQSYYIAYEKNKIERVDANNYRFISLVNPIALNTIWYGNNYLDSTQYRITDNTSYSGWQYQYNSVSQPFTVINSTFQNTCTVLQVADSSGVFDPSNISYKTYSKEVYAKGVGLIYKEISDYFYQTTPTPAYEDGSFGITLNLVSYK